ncbi:O-antigen ligase family protein [Patescibacteria group bacterium]|nr:O-antigen ligase family protein [Patescibacteria group bacterium]MBU4000441.1 O-antigen ligase family protein [Patescibacteria group bacterium]MBU4057200.1 O-antigen ligase family protein [Patescibacteria group bacterium]MBU4368222.1 O-antigen ligase family protein [Patescibacteria group bacterium]
MINKNHNLVVWGIYLIVFSLPAYLLRLTVLNIPFTALEILIYALFIAWLTKNHPFLFFKKFKEYFWANSYNKILTIGILLLLFGATVSTTFSPDLKISFGILKGWFLVPLLFFIVLISVIGSPKQVANVVKSFFLSGFIAAAISLVYFFSPSLGGLSYDNRLHGFYLSPNHLAMYLAPALIAGVFLFCCSKRNRAEKIFLLIALAVIFIPFYLTYSYAAWAALGFSLFLLLYFLIKKLSLGKKLLLLAACGLLFLVMAFNQTSADKFKNLKNLSYRSSINSRLMIWRAAWLIGKDHPLLGIGPGNFQKYYLDYQSRVLGTGPYLEWAVPQPHNIFLAFWLETGILGLAGFILLLFWFFRAGLDNFRKNKPLFALLFSLMVYTLIHGLVDTTYWKNDLSIIFWTIIGLAVVLLAPIRDKPLSKAGKNVFPKSSTGY